MRKLWPLLVLIAGCPKEEVTKDPAIAFRKAVDAMSLDLAQRPAFGGSEYTATALQDACTSGWTPACTPTWSGEGIARVRSAGAALAERCGAGDLAACTVVGWAGTQDVPGLAGPTDATDPLAGPSALRKACEGGITRACVDMANAIDAGGGVVPADADAATRAAASTSLLDGACGKGDHEACGLLGKRLLYEKPTDPARAIAVLDADCTAAPFGLSCAVLGVAKLHGDGGPLDPSRGAALLTSACDGGNPTACTRLAEAKLRGDGVPLDIAGASALFERTCGIRDGDGCAGLAAMVEKGQGVPKNADKAIALYLDACLYGNVAACAGGTRSDAHYLKDLDVACRGGDGEACVELGDLWAAPKRSVSERERGLLLLRKACESGTSFACGTLADRYEQGLVIRRDLRLAAEVHEKGCALDLMSSCKRLGELYATGEGPAKDRAKAAAAYDRPCAAGDNSACRSKAEQLLLASQEGTNPDGAKKAAATFKNACTAGDATACLRLSELRRDGIGIPADRTGSNAALSDACSLAPSDVAGEPACTTLVGMGVRADLGGLKDPLLESLEALCDAEKLSMCAQLGVYLRDGKGVAKDPDRAAELLKRACDGKITEACTL